MNRILPFLVLFTIYCLDADARKKDPGKKPTENLLTGMAQAPFLFMENKGQLVDRQGNTRPDILFAAKSGNTSLFFSANSITYRFHKINEGSFVQPGLPGALDGSFSSHPACITTNQFTISLQGANPEPEIIKEKKAVYAENFFLAHCPRGILNVNGYEQVTFREVYPFIDWVIYSINGTLKYDFIVHAGGNPLDIKLKVSGAKAQLEKSGELLIRTKLGEVKEKAPVSFSGGKLIPSRFIMNKDGTIGFRVRHRTTIDLVIDPAVSWSTYFGGPGGEIGQKVAVDRLGNSFVCGNTNSRTGLSYDGANNIYGGIDSYDGAYDAFLVKFSPAGTRLWATYYGGSGADTGNGITVDNEDNVYMVGSTNSENGIASGGIKNNLETVNGRDAFIVKFSNNGARLWATYYGGSSLEDALAVVTDKANNIYVTGYTMSSTGIAMGGFQSAHADTTLADAFLIKLGSGGNLLWGTYYGGTGAEESYAVTVDDNSYVYIAGQTRSSNGIAITGFQSTLNGVSDGFLLKAKPDGTPVWGTYYGGPDFDNCRAVAPGKNGEVFVAGTTSSQTGIAFNGNQQTYGGSFLVRFGSAGQRDWATYLGCNSSFTANTAVADSKGDIYIGGYNPACSYFNYPGSFWNLGTSFVMKISNTGQLLLASQFGGNKGTSIGGMALDTHGALLIAGSTSSTTGLSLNAFQPQLNGFLNDAFLAKIIVDSSKTEILNPAPAMVLQNGTLENTGSKLNLLQRVSGIAADNVAKLLLVVRSTVPVHFLLVGQQNGNGSLSSLTSQATLQREVTIQPDVNGNAVCIYNAPDGYGDLYAGLSRELTVLVNDINGKTFDDIHFDLVTPPVIMAHGMWSSPAVWNEGGFVNNLKANGFSTPVLADYALMSHTTFDPASVSSAPGRNAVTIAIRQALENYRDKNIAVAQVDVVAHSLGGLMTRSASQQNIFKTAGNYHKGYVHKLITLGTPHRGSPLASALWKRHNTIIGITTLSNLLKLAGQPVGSCHQDFAFDSDALKNLTQTLPFHAFAIAGDWIGGQSSGTQFKGYTAMYTLCDIFFPGGYNDVMSSYCSTPSNPIQLNHDLIVPLSSQLGYSAKFKIFDGTAHSGPAVNTETNSPLVQAQVIKLLRSDNSADFNVGFPAPTSFPRDCNSAKQKPMKYFGRPTVQDHGLRKISIVQPQRGTSFLFGDPIPIKLKYDTSGGCKPASALIMIEGVEMSVGTVSGSFETDILLPANLAIGKKHIVVFVKDSSGALLADTSHIMITPPGALVSLEVFPKKILLDSSLRSTQLQVTGSYKTSNGSLLSSLVSSELLVFQTSSNGSICKADSSGSINAVQPGLDTVEILHGNIKLTIPVEVDSNYAFVTLLPNSINFPAIDQKYTNSRPFVLEAFSSTGEDVAFELMSGPAELNENVIIIRGEGNITVKASAARNQYFNDAMPVVRSFLVSPVPVFTFNGNGNWSDTNNWLNGEKPPATLSNGNIFIDPSVGGSCILDIPVSISNNVNLTVQPGKIFIISGNLNINETGPF